MPKSSKNSKPTTAPIPVKKKKTDWSWESKFEQSLYLFDTYEYSDAKKFLKQLQELGAIIEDVLYTSAHIKLPKDTQKHIQVLTHIIQNLSKICGSSFYKNNTVTLLLKKSS